MAIKTTGSLGINADIVAEFGGTSPHAISEYSPEIDIVAGNQVSMSQFYGAFAERLVYEYGTFYNVTYTEEIGGDSGSESITYNSNNIHISISSYYETRAVVLEFNISETFENYSTLELIWSKPQSDLSGDIVIGRTANPVNIGLTSFQWLRKSIGIDAVSDTTEIIDISDDTFKDTYTYVQIGLEMSGRSSNDFADLYIRRVSFY